MGQIDAAIAYLAGQKKPNYAKAARLFAVSRLTLYRRYTGKHGSRREAASRFTQLLDDVQEDTILRYIDELTYRFISLTT